MARITNTMAMIMWAFVLVATTKIFKRKEITEVGETVRLNKTRVVEIQVVIVSMVVEARGFDLGIH